MQCSGIKGDGTRCTARAKRETRCGTHNPDKYASVDEETNVFKSYIIDRYRCIIAHADYRSRIRLTENRVLYQRSIEELFEEINRVEGLLRQDYPGYTGVFTRKTLHTWLPLKPVIPNYRLAAERRCITVGLARQIPLMHEWYSFTWRNLMTVHRTLQLPDLYNPQYVDEEFIPVFIARYNEFTDQIKDILDGCFRNMVILNQPHIRRMADQVPVRQEIVRNGAAFIADNQNVHRKETVKHVTDVFNKLMEIVVPPTQTTLGSVIQKCNLPPKAIIQLTQHYCEPVDIYEIPRAYPRALDAVWAYIEFHPEKTELYTRVRDELTDNVGMCAQGNLSRICNIVSGYIDGIQPHVPQGELLQNAIAAIATDNEGNKIERAKAVFRELHIPEEQWGDWIEAL